MPHRGSSFSCHHRFTCSCRRVLLLPPTQLTGARRSAGFAASRAVGLGGNKPGGRNRTAPWTATQADAADAGDGGSFSKPKRQFLPPRSTPDPTGEGGHRLSQGLNQPCIVAHCGALWRIVAHCGALWRIAACCPCAEPDPCFLWPCHCGCAHGCRYARCLFLPWPPSPLVGVQAKRLAQPLPAAKNSLR